MGHARLAVEMLTTADERKAAEIARSAAGDSSLRCSDDADVAGREESSVISESPATG